MAEIDAWETEVRVRQVRSPIPDLAFRYAKRLFDVAFAIALLPIFLLAWFVVSLLNPLGNPGPVFFVQDRMGRDQTPFRMVKFRTMTAAAPDRARDRAPEAALEVARITPFGAVMRRLRIDELPQVLNVLLGDMSVIGPRPDCLEHAAHYLPRVRGYAARYAVSPGITGLAQIEVGYVEGLDGTRRKVEADMRYIARQGFAQETAIVLRTVGVILRAEGR
jgi:lipopolysaccharide/colanic/teichoic acid biosynthesis glycosyltransferase